MADTAFTAADFSPAPQVVELLEHETTLAVMIASLRLIRPDFQPLWSESAVRVPQIVAYPNYTCASLPARPCSPSCPPMLWAVISTI